MPLISGFRVVGNAETDTPTFVVLIMIETKVDAERVNLGLPKTGKLPGALLGEQVPIRSLIRRLDSGLEDRASRYAETRPRQAVDV